MEKEFDPCSGGNVSLKCLRLKKIKPKQPPLFLMTLDYDSLDLTDDRNRQD